MQHLENDMDELFQRAAENYPLQEGKGDWESIEKIISGNGESPPAIAPVTKKGSKKFIALLLLLVLFSAGWFLFHNTQTSKSHLTATGATEKSKKVSVEPDIANNSSPASVNEKLFDVNGDKVTGNSKKNVTSYSSKTITVMHSDVGNLSSYAENNKDDQGIFGRVTENYTKTNNGSPRPGTLEGKWGRESITLETIAGRLPEQIKIAGVNETPDSLDNLLNKKEDFDNSEKKKKEAVTIPRKRKGAYVGIVAGPDFSKVQSGSFSNTGFDAGILLGFRFNRKLSIETGLIWNRKFYNTQGKDFSMDKVRSTMPSGMVINNLTSQSSLVEIPLKLKYDFIVKNNSAVFATGGVSSYIMTKEMNTYYVTNNSNQEKLLGVYKKNSYGLPAVANVSIGYEHRVSKNLDLRIEPFLKIPLQGMGVGSLPVTSAGLQLGISGRLK